MKSKYSIFLIIAILPFWALGIPFQGQKVLISAPSPYAVDAGREIFEAGGNVVDVAVTAALVIAVTSPYNAALGGGGFAMVKMNGKTEALDFREVAPSQTHSEFFLKQGVQAAQDGGAAVAVPGVPAGLWALHQKYGKLHWSRLFKSAINLASEGFRVSGEWSDLTFETKSRFNPAGIKTFFKAEAQPYGPGEVFKQKGLAKVLKEMQVRGVASFYKGIVARDIVDSVKKAGGVITIKDLESYRVRWLSPLEVQYQNYKIHLMPPPSSGGVVIASALRLTEKLNLAQTKPMSVDEYHGLAEVLQRAFRGRSLLGDPDFHKNPIDQLLSKSYLDPLAAGIDMKKSTRLKPLVADAGLGFKESNNTTHFTVMDHLGNTVAFTVTLNGVYGSGVVTDGFGIALNNEMDDFTTVPNQPNQFGLIQGAGNLVQAGKRPLSSMSPTIVEENGETVMALGAPGGPRIISAVFQVLYRVLTRKMDVDMAIQTGRVHDQFLPATLYLDEGRFSPEVSEGLKARGHQTKEMNVAKVFAITRNKNGLLSGAYDSRGEGAAGGY